MMLKIDLSKWFSWLNLGIENPETASVVEVVLQIVVICLVAFLVTFLIRKGTIKLLTGVIHKTKTKWDDIFLEERVFQKIFNLIPPVFIDFAFKIVYGKWEHIELFHRFIVAWILVVAGYVIVSVLDAINRIYESYPVARDRPIKVFVQVIKIFVVSAVVITIVSEFIGESPRNLLVGLGAFAAVLMLIFKDAILGFVAGVQLLSNQMVRIGDWIVMPSNNANGTVLEINLYTVKVQNWDMTITTVPTYQLVSNSFTNWRGMEESAGRRIMRYISIDMLSVHFLSDEEVDMLRKSEVLKEYIEDILPVLTEQNKGKEDVLDERRLTNLGVFRQYAVRKLQANPNLNMDMTYMVRQLQPTATGIPLEIYCFSRIQEWVAYEKVQSDIFDHLLAVMPYFHLRVFQYPSKL